MTNNRKERKKEKNPRGNTRVDKILNRIYK